MKRRLLLILCAGSILLFLFGCYGGNNTQSSTQNSTLTNENAKLKTRVAELEAENIELSVQVKNLNAEVSVLRNSQEPENIDETESIDEQENNGAPVNEPNPESGVNPFEELGFEFSPLLPVTINGLGWRGDGYIQFDSWTITNYRESHINDNILVVEIEMVGIKHTDQSQSVYLYYYDADGYALGYDRCLILSDEVNDSPFKIKKNFSIKEGTTRIEMKVE